MRIVRRSSFTPVPWKNGGGITHEALRVPPVGDPFRWRLSVARIDASGPFSNFAGYRRFMVLLEGAGVTLRFPAQRRALRAIGDLVEFDGALAPQCELENGPCVDLNLMVSSSLGGVRAQVEELHREMPLTAEAGRSMLIVPIDLAVGLEARGDGFTGETLVLEPWDLAVIGEAQNDRALLVPGAATPRAGKVFVADLPDR